MLNLLFWNLSRRPIEKRVAAAAHHHVADFVLLAECLSRSQVLRALNATSNAEYFPVRSESRVRTFTRFPEARFPVVVESRYATVRELRPIRGVRPSLLVAAVHLPSRRETDDIDELTEAAVLSRAVATAEERCGHRRTVVLGDFNMNPFDAGMVSGSGLHGVMTRDIAKAETRTVRGRECRYFYNPMWQFFGDATSGPPGTHFYRRSSERCLFWNIYDQVLIRPALLDSFRADGVRILDTDGVASLLGRNGRPDKAAGSDHLPVLLRLHL